jgi:L-asparaginase
MRKLKKILLIATGGTIASKHTENGMAPALSPDELMTYVPEVQEFCEVDTIQLFSMDSTNMGPEQWLTLAKTIEQKYEYYDGFVICHGTDTMAYTAAALSYLVQYNRRPIVITGAQKPIDLPITDARVNLRDSLRFASDTRAHGVNIVFGGKVIAGTRAKKEYSKSYNAFSSINFPKIAVIQDSRIVFYIDDKDHIPYPLTFYHDINPNVFLLKLIPGIDGKFLETIFEKYDAVIIESFGVGGFPDNGDHSFYDAIKKALANGKVIVMATQVTHEGSDMAVYQVGRLMKDQFDLPEAYDMTLEATVTKTMWALANADCDKKFKELFYQTINHDMLFCENNE